jgi:outer membrane protein assembly factor BamB
LVVEHGGRAQVVVAATTKVRSYDLETGEPLWEAAGLGRNQIPAPVTQGDLVFVMSGFIAPNLMAIRLGGRGDLTGTDAIVWENRQANSYTPSPVLFEDQLYVLTDGGVLTNFDATTGAVHYRERLPGPSNFKASPVAAAGKLYLASEEGQVFVVGMGPTFELLATNTLTEAAFVAAPAVTDGDLVLRSRAGLYRVVGR